MRHSQRSAAPCVDAWHSVYGWRTSQTEGLRSALALADEILALEKKCRHAQDGQSGARLCSTYIQLLFRVRETPKDGTHATGTPVVFDLQGEMRVDPLDPQELVTCDTAKEGFVVEFVDARRCALICQEAAALLKKRGQLKPSVSAVVRVCMQLIPYLQLAEKLELIEGLKTATDGKVRQPSLRGGAGASPEGRLLTHASTRRLLRFLLKRRSSLRSSGRV